MMVVRNVNVIDAVSDGVADHVDVVIEDGRFKAIGQGAASGELPPDAVVIEASGGVLVPGLIDCHAHYTIDAEDPEGIPRSQHEPLPPAAIRSAGMARRAIEAGITSMRSGGGQGGLDLALRDAIAAGHVVGPRILAAGLVVTTTGGHGFQFGREADDRQAVITAVRANARDGVDVIKVMSSEAAMLTHETAMLSTDEAGAAQYEPDELAAIVAEAHRLGRRVMSHAQGSEAVKRSAAAGVDSVEHAFLADDEALGKLAETGTFLVPTLLVTDVWSRIEGINDEQRSRQDELERRHRRSCESAIRMGVRTATGTDTGVPGVLPEMLWREVQLLNEHGATPIDALRGATIRAAELLGIASEVGSIEVGKQADAVLLDGDPLADLSALSRPRRVIREGKTVFEASSA